MIIKHIYAVNLIASAWLGVQTVSIINFLPTVTIFLEKRFSSVFRILCEHLSTFYYTPLKASDPREEATTPDLSKFSSFPEVVSEFSGNRPSVAALGQLFFSRTTVRLSLNATSI